MMEEQAMNSKKLEALRQCVNNEDYLHAAIQRLALILRNELMDLTQEGVRHERQRKRRK
jgi:hypothetical protein